MERPSKLADLTLVSKYYPVANYSYPRNEPISKCATQITAACERTSLDSEGSAPGLVDDRTDSEVSGDDDYQYRALTAEIWDTFWQPGDEEEVVETKKVEPVIHPKKQYPALIPSPQRRRQRSTDESGRQSPGWPFPDSAPALKSRGRNPAGTYSAFPKPAALPCPTKPASPSWESSRYRQQPRRPPRPDERLLTPCIQQRSTLLMVAPSVSDGPWSAPLLDRSPSPTSEPRRSQASLDQRQPTPVEVHRPTTSQSLRPPTPAAEPRKCKSSRSLRPFSPIDISRPKTSCANRPPTPFEPDAPAMLSPSMYLHPMPDASDHPAMRHQRSFYSLSPDPEPRSVFEDDSDAEDEDDGGRSFFRFHKRSTSDLRRSARSAEPEVSRRRRGRTTPSPTRPRTSTSTSTSTGRQSTESKRPAADVFARMLGRRSR